MLCCRVLLFPLPLVGHNTPMLHLGNALHSKGFSITIIHTHFNTPDPSKFPNFTFRYVEETLSKTEDPPADFLQIMHHLNTSSLAPFQDCLTQVMEEATKGNEPVACLIFDPFWQFAATVAEGFNLPRIALRTGGMLAFILYDALPLLHEKGYFPLQEARKEELVPEVPPLKVKDLTSEVYHDSLIAMVKEVKRCTHGLICNTYEELELAVLDRVRRIASSIPVFAVGPLHKYSSNYDRSRVTDDQSCLMWLNKHALNSVLYVSFGTLATIRKEQFFEVAWGLAASKQPFLWVIRPDLIDGSDKNDSFPENFLKTVAGRSLIVPWAPQSQVLAHPAVGGFWTHCGWNSTIESISEGVPMICSPIFVDQKASARLSGDILRIGLVLEKGLEKNEIEKAIIRMMVEKEGEEMRERVAVLKKKADQCIREGGSSYEALDRLTSHILSFSCATRMRI